VSGLFWNASSCLEREENSWDGRVRRNSGPVLYWRYMSRHSRRDCQVDLFELIAESSERLFPDGTSD